MLKFSFFLEERENNFQSISSWKMTSFLETFGHSPDCDIVTEHVIYSLFPRKALSVRRFAIRYFIFVTNVIRSIE